MAIKTLNAVALAAIVFAAISTTASAQCYSGDTICQGQQNSRMFEENQRRQQESLDQMQRNLQQQNWQLQQQNQQNQQRYP